MIHIDAISKQHGKQILFIETSATMFRGEKVGLVGPNGAGKTTIFRMIMQQETPDEGQVRVDKNISLGYFSQDVGEMRGRSVVAETMDGAGPIAQVAAELALLEQALADPARVDELDTLVTRFGEVQARFEELDGYGLDARAREILAGLGFAQEVMDNDVGKLSGGWKMRVALARILLMRPDVLLLDEPTNHLDLESILWLEQYLRDFQGAVVMTSHDREFLNRLVTKIVEIEAGELVTYVGNYDFYEQQRALGEAQAQAQYERQQAMLAKEIRFIERFKAQAGRAAQVQSRVKKLDKIEKLEPPRRRKVLSFDFRPAPRSGNDVIKIAGVSKAYGKKIIYDNFELMVRRHERWCIMGENGAGKSTLLKLIAGQTEPDSGAVTIGAAVKVGYFAQHAMDLLDASGTVLDTLMAAFPIASIGQLKALAGAFGFSGEDADKPVRILSGGEKARVVLALMLYDPPNLLILDEPTNHLDMATKDMLVTALRDFEGTMIFVSHDRRFLAALSNRVLELGSGPPRQYGGGYNEYVAQSGHEAPGMRQS